VSKHQGQLRGDGGEMKVDKSYVVTASIMYDAVLIAGGRESVETLRGHGDALHFVNETFRHCKTIGALGEAVGLLAHSQIVGVDLSETGEPVADQGVVTLAGTAARTDTTAFSERFVEMIGKYRHWEREKDGVPA
jgi:catalase